MFGATEEEIVRGGREALIDPEDPRYEDAFRERTRTGRIANRELTFVRKSGEKFAAETSSVIIPDATQTAFVILRDITERKRAEEALRAKTQQLESLLTSAPLGVTFFDASHRFVQVNEELAAINGVPAKSHLGRAIEDMLPAVAPAVAPLIDRVFKSGEAIGNVELTGDTPRELGVPRHWLAGFYPVRCERGEVILVGAWVAEITAMRRAQEALQAGKEQFALALKAAQAGSFDWDAKADIAVWSEELLALYGLTRDEFGGRYADWVTCVLREPGVQRHWLTGFYPVVDDEGRVVLVGAWAAETTAMKRAERELREADRRKDEFLAVLAHELRNPLAPVRTGLQVMRVAGADEARRLQIVTMMERQVGHMVRLVDELLDVSRIARGKIELKRERIELRAQREGGVVRVSVKDNGIGIPQEKLLSIFDMSSQLGGETAVASAGLGIGLSLVKGIVGLHGGSVEACSAGLGHGAEFIVRLPIAVATGSVTDEREKGVNGAAGLRVLLVDDNVDAAESLVMLLGIMGNEVHTAHAGMDAIQRAAELDPHVVLLDIGLPDMSGYETCRSLRAQPWAEGLTIIAVTGRGQEEDRRQAAEAGFNHHLTKPVAPEALIRLLSGIKAGRRRSEGET